MKDDLIEILLLTKDRLNEIDVKSKYAYAYFIREQRFLLEVLEEIPNAKNIPGIYFSPFIETGYKNGYPSYKVVLMEATIKKTLEAIERVLLMNASKFDKKECTINVMGIHII